MNGVIFFQKQLGQVGTILTSDSGDERDFFVLLHPRQVERPASKVQLPTSNLRPRLSSDRTSPAEFFLQLRQRNLNHRRPSVRATIRQIAAEQVLDEFFHFEI